MINIFFITLSILQDLVLSIEKEHKNIYKLLKWNALNVVAVFGFGANSSISSSSYNSPQTPLPFVKCWNL